MSHAGYLYAMKCGAPGCSNETFYEGWCYTHWSQTPGSTAKVVDFGKEIEVKVTAEDIYNGTPEDSCTCAVALAVKRVLGAEFVKVDHDSIYVRKSLYRVYEYETSQALQEWLDLFDSTIETLEPITIILAPPIYEDAQGGARIIEAQV